MMEALVIVVIETGKRRAREAFVVARETRALKARAVK